MSIELKLYLDSWRKYCPDYEIIELNETNFDYTKYQFSKEAYETRNWAFVSDVARLEAIYIYGGIYLDTDVEVIKNFDDLLSLRGFVGAEDKYDLNTGAAFGAEKKHPIILENLMEYKNLPLIVNNKINKVTCVELTTRVMKRHGYKKAQKVQEFAGMTVFPSEYFSPLKLTTNKLNVTKNTYSIHHYTTNWKNRTNLKKWFVRRTVPIKKFSRRTMDDIFGENTYNYLKNKLK